MKRNINIHKTISIYYNMLRKHFDLGALAGQPGQPWLKYFYYFHVAKGADMNEIMAIRLQPGIRPGPSLPIRLPLASDSVTINNR